MELLDKLVHPHAVGVVGRTLHRRAARGVILDGDDILLLFTERYNDFSLPGGGVDPHEDLEQALHREVREETGARNVQVLAPYGRIEELRPHYRDYALMFMESFLFLCGADRALGDTALESYERDNGMSPLWVNLEEALAHNTQVMAAKEAGMGLSIERETRVLTRLLRERDSLQVAG